MKGSRDLALPEPPAALEFLSLPIFSSENLAVQELHAEGGLQPLIDFFTRKPYLHDEKLSCGGSLLFVLGIVVAQANINLMQFSEVGGDWADSRLSFDHTTTLEEFCMSFCADISGKSYESRTSQRPAEHNKAAKRSAATPPSSAAGKEYLSIAGASAESEESPAKQRQVD